MGLYFSLKNNNKKTKPSPVLSFTMNCFSGKTHSEFRRCEWTLIFPRTSLVTIAPDSVLLLYLMHLINYWINHRRNTFAKYGSGTPKQATAVFLSWKRKASCVLGLRPVCTKDLPTRGAVSSLTCLLSGGPDLQLRAPALRSSSHSAAHSLESSAGMPPKMKVVQNSPSHTSSHLDDNSRPVSFSNILKMSPEDYFFFTSNDGYEVGLFSSTYLTFTHMNENTCRGENLFKIFK